MKPIFGINLTENKQNDQFSGAGFLVQQPSAALTQALNSAARKAEDLSKQGKLPTPLRIVKTLCGFLAAMIAVGILRGLSGVTIRQAYENAGYLFWLGGACFLVWAVLWLIGKEKEKAVMGKEESGQTLSNFESICKAIYGELSVPEDAQEVDILSFYYKEKSGKIKPCENGIQMTTYLNPVFKAFADEENLYIANLEGKYAFPRACIQSIQTVKKHITMASWNKELACNEGIYKQYKVTRDNYGFVHCTQYCILEIEKDGETWGLYFPCYELPTFEELTK